MGSRWAVASFMVLSGLTGCERPPAPVSTSATAPTTVPSTRTAASETPEQALVRKAVSELLGVKADDLKMSMRARDLKMDDLDVVELTMELEDQTNTSISDDELQKRAGSTKDFVGRLTLQDFADLVTEAKKRPKPNQRTSSP